MIKQFKIITLLFFITPFFTYCGQYEEGPALSLRSKKARVANVWEVEYAYDYEDEEEITRDFSGETFEFEKDGVFTKRDQGTVDESGIWQFVNDKQHLRIDVQQDTDVYKILKLKEKEMWLEEAGEEEIHLVPAN